MDFSPPLIPARLIKRYKRFLADVELTNGDRVTVHCPNTGSMTHCWEPGWRVYLQDSNNPKRKYPLSWILSETPQGELIGVNTQLANTLVEEALNHQLIHIPAVAKNIPLHIQKEVKYGHENSRIDFLVSTPEHSVYIEVKSVTLLEKEGIGYFPDAVSLRGQKHLRELQTLAENKQVIAMLLFCVQHTGIREVRAAQHIDPDYASLLAKAQKSGVHIQAYQCDISQSHIHLARPLPFQS